MMKMMLIPFFAATVAVCYCRSMGVDPGCDDGETDLQVDWDGSENDYVCKDPRGKILGSTLWRPAKHECEFIPRGYLPTHYCMNETVVYEDPMPTHAGHRPVWAVYGEYHYLPPQRWSHNIEHGGVVMLYHPCTKPYLVEQLRRIVTGCLRRHVITPSNRVPEDTPMVLIAWGCRLKISSSVNELFVKSWIRQRALKAIEFTPKDGAFKHFLKKQADVVSDFDDTNLCPR